MLQISRPDFGVLCLELRRHMLADELDDKILSAKITVLDSHTFLHIEQGRS